MSSESFKHGTAIVVLKTPEAIYVAADSMVGVSGGGPNESECKIRFERDTGYAFAGVYVEPETAFHLRPIIQNVAALNMSIAGKGGELERILGSQALNVFRAIRRHPHFSGPRVLGIQVVFFGYENGSAEAAFVTVEGSKAPDSLELRRQGFSSEAPLEMLFVAGSRKVLATMQEARVVKIESFEAAAEDVIRRAAVLLPDKVGLPVDVVKVTASGRTWNKRKDGCPL